MDAELMEIRQHMSQFPPFDALSEALLEDLAGHIEVRYFKTGSDILLLNADVDEFCYIRSGAVEVYRRQGDLYNRLGEGDIFGHFHLLRDHVVRFPARAIEDTLIYFIPDAVFQRLCDADEHFADFVELERPRLETAAEEQREANDMMVTRIRRLLSRAPVMVGVETSVQNAALKMSEDQASALLVTEPCSEDTQRCFHNGHEMCRIRGIMTNSDFRTRIVAQGLPAQTAIGDVVSRALISVQADVSIYEAMLAMLRNNVHHLPVLHRQRPLGIVHLSDIIRYETHSGLYLVSNIFSRLSVEGLARLAPDVRAAFVRMVREGANSQMIGTALSTIGRSFTRRLCELAEESLGPPPVPYAFMVNGSMARNEQGIVTDQDNALVLDNAFDPEEHDDYFRRLATFVSDGLDACGYTYCKGDIMATNARWRQPLDVWKGYFREWINEPTPETLLHSSIFFDLDSAYGEAGLVEQLQDLITEQAPRSSRFLAAMARNALNRTPPLGFFRTIVMEKDGKHNNSINLKRRGTAPMVDLIRIHALACGSSAQNTFERLDDIHQTRLLASGVSDKLRYAFEFLCMSRLRHQAIDIDKNRNPDNNIEPENVESSERHTLKDAFQVLSNAQKFLKFRYPMAGGQTERR
ncbi:DUF294 nucleotidyltransferase-like domain-containing protein [Halomonas piscis]|uniref:DUF294 nucleotidyltransferase-like domain-containing protein n=1 Tax=Halomonas piscis TaxID=3031727 RepID=A0ABY9Z2L8_9GAMM|nr:DUF294 nucleotidyltransferase-like domain-containing protein [Halomonas piscis]WNK20916.1 DUF294 nucleotidyltransferase-like domain-containing protein [Halomonas piscis]